MKYVTSFIVFLYHIMYHVIAKYLISLKGSFIELLYDLLCYMVVECWALKGLTKEKNGRGREEDVKMDK